MAWAKRFAAAPPRLMGAALAVTGVGGPWSFGVVGQNWFRPGGVGELPRPCDPLLFTGGQVQRRGNQMSPRRHDTDRWRTRRPSWHNIALTG